MSTLHAHGKIDKRVAAWAALAAAAAATAVTPAAARAADQGDAITIAWSGATFMRSFTTSRGISLLNPGTQITLNVGPGGSPVTFRAANNDDTAVQLAAQNLNAPLTPFPGPADAPANQANYYAVRFEWHEQGSIEGINELINDQVGAVPSVSLSNRNGNFGNPLWVNSNPFGANNVNVVPGAPPFGAGVPGTTTLTVNGHQVRTSTYNAAHASAGGIYDDANPARPGRNTQGGQNRIQQAVSDVHASQGFARAGTPAWNRTPGTPGYGLGNPALPVAANGADIQGVGTANARHQFNAVDIMNMPTDRVDPTTGSNYAPGPWNNAADANLDNRVVAVGGMAYVANPGTGLERVNRTDNVWLHAAGRLQNGADFNVVTRDAYSGTVNSATNNIGLDTTWAVGENDDGNTNDTATAAAQTRIGDDIRFSGKTSGGQGVRPTVQNSRMAFGHLSSSDSIPNSKAGSSRPMRTLDYRDDANDLADGSNDLLPPDLRNDRPYADPIAGTDASKDIFNGFTRLSARSIVEGSYASRTNQTYVTVKAARTDLLAAFLAANPAATEQQVAQWWAGLSDADTGIKGDNSGNDVRDFRDNILNSVADFPVTSVANAADQMLNLAYMLPQFVKLTKDLDGLNRDVPNPAYDANLASQFLATPSLVAPFNPDAPSSITTGSNSTYGNNNLGNASATPAGGSIPINAKNWLFGDFDQRTPSAGVSGKGTRDFSDLAVAQQAQAALAATPLGVDWNVNPGSNAANVPSLPAAMNNAFTKGDLIALGDFDSDGDFDGQDLYRMARGTSLTDSPSSTTLTGPFADALRHGVLRKNAALDQLNASATPQQKLDASAHPVNDPAGVNAFNKLDVNRDGRLDLNDAFAVDKFFGQDYRNLEHQLAATLAADGTITPTAPQRTVSLVDVELTDNGAIDAADITVVNQALAGPGNESWTGPRTKVGAGNIVSARTAGTVSITPGASLTVAAGRFTVAGALSPFTDTTTAAHLPVTVSGSATLQLAPAGPPTVTLASLTLADSARADLTTRTLALPASAASQVRQYLAADQLTSSTPDPTDIYSLAYLDTGTSLLIKLSFTGDANVDGLLNADDFALLDRGFARQLTSPYWTDGDFNYDGTVTSADFFLLDRTFGILHNFLAPSLLVHRQSQFGNEYVSRLIVAVPEPTAIGGVLAAGAALVARRRRAR